MVLAIFFVTFSVLKLRHQEQFQSSDYSSSVNRYIQATQIQIEQQSQALTSDLESIDTIINQYKKDPKEKKYLNEAELNEQLNPKKQQGRMTVAERIQQELFNQDFAASYDDSYKRKYAEQFIENARRGGFEVRLDQNFKVIGVTKLRVYKGMALFENRTPQSFGSQVMYKPHKARSKMPLKPSVVFKKTFPNFNKT